MCEMFALSVFNGDLSKWDVSSVQDMSRMFLSAKLFTQTLCGDAWVQSQAKKDRMFEGSPGGISQQACMSGKHTLDTMEITQRQVSRRPNPERELITGTPAGTPSIIPTIANRRTCPKCGTFGKSGRVSCCAPGGAWYNNCGGSGNRNAEYRWFEGMEACERKSKANGRRFSV